MDSTEIRHIEIEGYTKEARDSALFFVVRELAAQLADLNEHFRMVDASVFGAKKK